MSQVDSLNFLLLLFWFVCLFSFFYFVIFVKILPSILLNFFVRLFFFTTHIEKIYIMKTFINLSFFLENKNVKNI